MPKANVWQINMLNNLMMLASLIYNYALLRTYQILLPPSFLYSKRRPP